MKTVADLIAELQKYPSDMPVMAPEAQGGFNRFVLREPVCVALDARRQDYGADYEEVQGGGGVRVLVISAT